VPSLADKVLESARQVIEDQSTDYTLDKVYEELELMARHGWRLWELLDIGKRDGFAGHLEFE
jgi:phytoene/squalene synthetase